MTVWVNSECNVAPCSLDFTQLNMSTDGNLRYAVYSVLSFSSAPIDLHVLFKDFFLKKAFIVGNSPHRQKPFIKVNESINVDTCCSMIVLPVKPAQKLNLRTLFVPESLKEAYKVRQFLTYLLNFVPCIFLRRYSL